LGSTKLAIGNQVKHVLIILSILLLYFFLSSCDKKERVKIREE